MGDLLSSVTIEVIAGVIVVVLTAVGIVLRKQIRRAWMGLRNRHAARMRRKYPCERQHVDDPLPFLHPAKFEVTMVTNGDRWHPALMNIGQGDAFKVVASDSPLPNVFVRAPSSWESIPADARELIGLRFADDLPLMSEWQITVEWTDANGQQHVDAAVHVDEVVRNQVNPFRH